MRIQYKGGVWKNSEDEILKAAVMKYGKNQWARIASLLVRKSAKQCKARWYEWLDPSIKKTEWTREEEERLLHLAKIMPTQWRTIAPMIGRTAAQCLEHYERLLEDAQKDSADKNSEASGKNPLSSVAGPSNERRFHTLDVDQTAPETRPARPDPVDMDEEEKEMLSEARARLANTRGKKAKRKAREKLLDEAKRLASLQKRRELKAAGIEVKETKRKRGSMDLTTEVPYMRAPAAGYYDTRSEIAQLANENSDTRGLGRLIEVYEHQQHEKSLELQKRRDALNFKQLVSVNQSSMEENATKSAKSSGEPIAKRSRLSLPAPQVSDLDLESIAKAGASVTKTVNAAGKGHNITIDLMHGLTHPVLRTPSKSSVSSSIPTPRTLAEPWVDLRNREVHNILKLQTATTPLVGGDNDILPSDLGVHDSVTPLRTPLRTPNPWASPSISSSSSVPGRTLNISEIARTEKLRVEIIKRELSKRLDSLPQPENDYEIFVGETSKTTTGIPSNMDTEIDADFLKSSVDEDADDELKRIENEERALLEGVKARMLSSSSRRGLPLPPLTSLPSMALDLQTIVERDHVVCKILSEATWTTAKRPFEVVDVVKKLVDVDDADEFVQARALIDEEMANGSGPLSEADILEALEHSAKNSAPIVFIPSRGNGTCEDMDVQEIEQVYNKHSAHLVAVLNSLQKLKRKADIVIGGYAAKNLSMTADLRSSLEELEKVHQEIACFKKLVQDEKVTGPNLVAELHTALARQRDLERYLQSAYASLTLRQ